MRTKAIHILTACLTFVAAFNVIGFAVGMVLWVTIGDTHDRIWAASKYPVIAGAILIPVIYLVLDVGNRTSSRGISSSGSSLSNIPHAHTGPLSISSFACPSSPWTTPSPAHAPSKLHSRHL